MSNKKGVNRAKVQSYTAAEHKGCKLLHFLAASRQPLQTLSCTIQLIAASDAQSTVPCLLYGNVCCLACIRSRLPRCSLLNITVHCYLWCYQICAIYYTSALSDLSNTDTVRCIPKKSSASQEFKEFDRLGYTFLTDKEV